VSSLLNEKSEKKISDTLPSAPLNKKKPKPNRKLNRKLFLLDSAKCFDVHLIAAERKQWLRKKGIVDKEKFTDKHSPAVDRHPDTNDKRLRRQLRGLPRKQGDPFICFSCVVLWY
jgi:hypothetical protein